jgi:adenine-specific DNA-methyltransferase
MSKKTKLELTWIGKEHRPKLEPRILLEEPERSHHAAHRVTDRDIFDNRLIHGDNLLALKALEQDFAGKVKCIFIDPRYPNLTVKKIPKVVLGRCEWGKDDYSLKVENLPKAPPKPGQMELFDDGGAA